MITLIRKAKVYAPEALGVKDVLVVGDAIAAVADELDAPVGGGLSVREVDAEGKVLVPGFIDGHVHILGGGGEGGFATRTPEVTLTTLTTAGVTTVVGTLGTDGVGRDTMALLAKAKGLRQEGVTAYCYTGAYRIPVPTLTDSVMKDIMAVDEIIGVGEVALSDHRSSQPTFEEFVRLVADARVAGMLSGKAGIVNIHMGDGKSNLSYVRRAVAETELPRTQFLPTHMGRNPELFEDGITYMKEGGYCDFTGAEDPDLWEREYGEVRYSKVVRRIVDEGIDLSHFTFTSDGQGSFPMFDDQGEYLGIGIGKSSCLLEGVKECVFREGIGLDVALRGLTANPADLLKLPKKGRIAPEKDADLVLLDETSLDIDTVWARGKVMVEAGRPVVFGTFEPHAS
ncbi:MAG: beta-aspartyl-peptidase [Peptoniphilaceae bacterium]|nr:beta-aspartyl-peptidase [Peptoniphilaceae bacterium]MDY6086230.1 beta-aspartyl-peptidase [Peptoniphilaceae bacterium]